MTRLGCIQILILTYINTYIYIYYTSCALRTVINLNRYKNIFYTHFNFAKYHLSLNKQKKNIDKFQCVIQTLGHLKYNIVYISKEINYKLNIMLFDVGSQVNNLIIIINNDSVRNRRLFVKGTHSTPKNENPVFLKPNKPTF